MPGDQHHVHTESDRQETQAHAHHHDCGNLFGCGDEKGTGVLREDIKGKLLTVPGVRDADVQVVFDPPWSLQMMSDVAKLQLGMM